MFVLVTGWLVLVHGFPLVEREGGDEEETVVVVAPEDLRDGQEFLFAFLPDLGRGQQVEDEAAEEEDWETPDSDIVHPVVSVSYIRVLHLDVEVRSEELLRQLSYAIKNQLGHPKPPTRGFGTQRPNGSLLALNWFFMA